MAKKEEPEHEPLTEEQRITALEERVGTNKIVLLVVALILIVTISVSVTVFAVFAMGEDDASVDMTMIEELNSEIASLQKTLEAQKSQISKLKRQIPVIHEQLENSSNLKLQSIILEQEKANLDFLDALKTGMYDLAHMLPGSRTWLEVYGEKVDLAEAHSQSRVKELNKLRKSTASSQSDDDPFEDF